MDWSKRPSWVPPLLWILLIGVYKIAEDWALEWTRGKIAQESSTAVTTFLHFLPIVTWFLAAGALVWITKRVGIWATMPPDQAQKQQPQTHIDMSGVVRQSHERILVLLRGELITYLTNRPVDSDWGLEKLRQDFNWWETRAAEALERAGASDSEVSWLKEVGPYPPTGLRAYNDDHTRLLSLLVEKQKRLEKIMTRLGFFSGG